MTGKELADLAINIFNHASEWTYNLGSLGELAEDKRTKSLYEYYWKEKEEGRKPNSMTRPYDEWLPDHKGQRCTDCNNFINMLLGYDTNKYSVWAISKLPRYYGDVATAPAGCALYMPGHVGISIGGGEMIDFHRYEEGPRRAPISEGLWQYAVYLKEVIYSKPIRIDAKLKRTDWKVGDRITPDDIQVTATYGAGQREITGFQITPLMVTNTICQVAVTYCDCVAYCRIDAKSTGSFYAVMLPVSGPGQALEVQQKMLKDGYADAAIINL